MMPYLQDADFTLWNGDALEVLRGLPDESVDCAATSPPFYGLRDYGVKGQIGLESSQREWLRNLSGVFEEVRRVLKPAGTLWIECGDSYVSGQGGRQSAVGELPPTTRFDRKDAGKKRAGLPSSFGERDVGPRFYPARASGLKPKDLLLSPFMLAQTLQFDGWWLRQIIIWHKPNCMPESATDRCTTAHSYVFLLSKRARYWFDAEAISEEFSPNTNSRGKGIGVKQALEDQGGTAHAGRNNASFGRATAGDLAPHLRRVPQVETLDGSEGETPRGPDGRRATHVEGRDGSLQHRNGERWPQEGKNPRSVWTIPTEGYPEAHFATWPQALVERILKAGCPEWVCVGCGKPRERVTEATYGKSPKHGAGSTVRKRNEDVEVNGWAGEQMPRLAKTTETVGWSDCGCGVGFTAGTVLDPFMGSGTTALVARRLGRKSIGIELNAQYAELAAKRLGQQSLLTEGAV